MGPLNQPFLQRVSSMASSFANIFENQHTTIVNIIGVIVAFVAEYVVEENGIFACPCTKQLAFDYGLSFILGGFIVFWMIGLLVYTQTWRICHGCCLSWTMQKCCIKLNYFFRTCIKTMVFPLAWVFAVLLDGDYIACMKSTSCDAKSEDYDIWKKTSQEWAFISLVVLLLVVVSVRSISRCCNEKSYEQYTLMEAYRNVEDEILFKTIPETANNLAPEVVQTFIQMKDLTPEEWIEATNESTNIGGFLSPLHKFINQERKPPSTTQVPLNVLAPPKEQAPLQN